MGRSAWNKVCQGRYKNQAKNLREEQEVVFMAKDKAIEKKGNRGMKGEKEKSETNAGCCYVVDPCGCYVDPCGCYV